MNEMQILNIGGVDCYEKDGTVYLKLENVARGLGFTDTSKGVEYVRWNTVRQYLKEIGFSQEVAKDSFIPENIFYRLAMKARNDTAENFQALVADEIIPSIRKHGGYLAGQETVDGEELLSRALLYCKSKYDESEKKIIEQAKRIEELCPKALFANAVAASTATILIGELAKVLKQNGVDIGQNRLFDWMRQNGYLIRRQGTDYKYADPTQHGIRAV